MLRFSISLLVLLATFQPLPILAQAPAAQTPGATNTDTVPKPKTAALGNLAARLSKARAQGSQGTAATHVTATRFTPTGQRLSLDAFVDSLAKTADEKAGLRQVLQTVFKVYEAAADKGGVANNVAAALAFYLAAHYSAYHDGREVTEAMSNALVSQLQTALDTDEMRGAPNEDKQRLYEFFIMMGGYTGTMQELGVAEKDAALQKVARQLGADGLKSILHVAADRVGIAATGLTISPDQPATVSPTSSHPTASGATVRLSDISYRLPAGWTEEKTDTTITLWHNKNSANPTDDRMSMLSITAGLPKTGSLADSMHTLWRNSVLPTFEGEAQPFPYMAQLPGGMNCAFGMADMKNKANTVNDNKYGIALYVIDAGDSLVSVLAIYWAAIDFVRADGNYQPEKNWGPPILQFFDSLRIHGAPTGQPLLTRHDLVGTWNASNSSSASYVNSRGDYVGDASSATASNYVFHADGTYSHLFVYVPAHGNFQKFPESGTYRIEKAEIIMTNKEAHVTRKHFLGRGATDDGKGTIFYIESVAGKYGPEFLLGSFYREAYRLTP